jgi:hypothetical protein
MLAAHGDQNPIHGAYLVAFLSLLRAPPTVFCALPFAIFAAPRASVFPLPVS